MTTAYANPSHACVKCGAALAELLGEARVTCHFCNENQPNPAPLRANDEVIYDKPPFAKIGRVVSCRGPDEITLENVKATFHLDQLIPVVVAQESELLPRTKVYAMMDIGWFQTTLVRVDASGTAIVKAKDQAFQADFFNRKLELDLLRLPLRLKDRRRPTRLDLWKDGFYADPFGTIVATGFKVIIFFMLMAIVTSVAYAIYTVRNGG